jgi:Type II secretion system (T2SS), protein G
MHKASRETRMRTPFKIGLAATIVVVAVCFICVDIIPPRSLTITRMHVMRVRIIQYGLQHGGLPERLTNLPPRPGYDSAITDAWGRPLDYSFDASGIVTLRSLGSDKIQGGDGNKRDIIGSFASHDAQGRWEDRYEDWIQTPL